MHTQDFNSGDRLTAAQLDTLQQDAQAADDAQAVDAGVLGVVRGLLVTAPGTGTLVNVTAGAAYNNTTGRRALRVTSTNFDVALDEFGAPTTVTNPLNTKILSLFIRPTTNTVGTPAGFPNLLEESHELVVRQSAEALNPTPPSLLTDAVLLADVTRYETGVQADILSADIDLSRRENAYQVTQAVHGLKIDAVSVIDALQQLLDTIGRDDSAPVPDNVAGAEYIGTTNGMTSAQFPLPDGTVNEKLANIVKGLGDGDGAAKVAATARSSTNLNLAIGSVSSQLISLVSQVGNTSGDNVVGATAKASGSSNLALGTVRTQLQALLALVDTARTIADAAQTAAEKRPIDVALASATLVENFGPTTNGGLTSTSENATAIVGLQLKVGQPINGLSGSGLTTGLAGTVKLQYRTAPAGSLTTLATLPAFGGAEGLQSIAFATHIVLANTNYLLLVETQAGVGEFRLEQATVLVPT